MLTKDELREFAKNTRKSLDIETLSKYFCQRLCELEIFKNSQNIMIYYPLKYELSFLEMLELAPSKNYYLPKVHNKNLIVCKFDKNSKLEKSSMNILEPCTKSIIPQELNLVIVPALMADKNNYRLGYGGGFYDRFIENFGQHFKTICAVPKELFIENLPTETFDKTIDLVLVGE